MKKTLKVGIVAGIVLMAAASMAFADAQEAGNAVVNGVTSILKMPIRILDKASDSLASAPANTAASEDVAVSDIYNLDAETTG